MGESRTIMIPLLRSSPFQVLLLFTFACASTRVVSLASDPDFTYESISANGLAIVGMTTLMEPDSTFADMASLAALLTQRIRASNPDVPVSSPDVLVASLGENDYRDALSTFEKTGSASVPEFADSSSAAWPSRFFIFGRIEADVFSHKTEDEKELPPPGSKEEPKEYKSYKTKREMMIRFCVFDRQSSRWVMETALKGTRETEEKYVENDDDPDWLEALDVIFGGPDSEDSRFPPGPPQEEVADFIFKRFVETIPQNPRK